MAQPRCMPPSAAQASLRADPQYLDLLAAQSGWPLLYAMSRPVAGRGPCSGLPVQGRVAQAAGPDAVAALNHLLPQNYRMAKRASQNRPQTELVNSAPYAALGRGVANHVDTSSALLLGARAPREASRAALAERRWDNMDFVAVPADLRRLPAEMRFGEMTRVGPAYAQPHE